jgi:hypothetical protein
MTTIATSKTSFFENNTLAFAIIAIIVVTLLVDTYFAKNFIFSQTVHRETIGAFTVIAITCMIGQYMILAFVKQKSRDILFKIKRLAIIQRVVTLSQYSLVAIFALLLLQVYLLSYYTSLIAIIVIFISYLLAFGVLALLAKQFFSWFKTNRYYIVLLYGLSSASLCINISIGLVLVGLLSQAIQPEVYPTASWFRPNLVPGSITLTNMLHMIYGISTIVSFIVTWVATALLLRHYSQRIGTALYWSIMGIPLLYFLSQFIILFVGQLILPQDPVGSAVLLALIFSLSKPIGGIVFGIAFWDITRKIRKPVIRSYMLTCSYGFMLFFVSSQIIGTALPVTPYPPFGFPAVLFTGLSSYLILVGIYSSAVSVSQDIKLRQSIRKEALKETKLIERIAWAQMEQEIRDKITVSMKGSLSSMIEDTGVQPSLSDNEIKEYLDDVLEEVKRKKEKSGL